MYVKREKPISVPSNHFDLKQMHFIAKEHNEVFWSTFQMQNRTAPRKCVVFIINERCLNTISSYLN